MSRPPPVSTPLSAFAKVDALAFVLLGAFAFVLRVWGLGQSGIDHWDEGAYALSALAVSDGLIPEGFYQTQRFLSPPVVFGSWGLTMAALGSVSDAIPVLLSSLAGALTVALSYLLVAKIAGRAAGLAASVLLALSDFHILYSGSGLTDVTFSFLFLLALVLYAEADARESWTWAVLAGLATGLAWNTKYHGWLAGVVAFIALFPHLLDRGVRRFVEGGARIAVAAVVASLLYAPWFVYVSGLEGGYARLVQEHQSFLAPRRALNHVWAHFQHQMFLDGWLGRLAPVVAIALVAVMIGPAGSAERKKAFSWVPVLLLAGLVLGGTITATLLALFGLVGLLRGEGVRRWTPIAFVLVFTLLSPMYSPYPRLLLPWVVGVVLLAGVGLVQVANAPTLAGLIPQRVPRMAAIGFALALGVACAIVRPPWTAAHTYAPSDGFETAAREVAGAVPAGMTMAVLGEPAVAFYLKNLGRDVRAVDGPLDFYRHFQPGDSVVLVAGRYTGLVGGPNGLRGWLEEHPGVAESVASFPVHALSDVRLLDDFDHAGARAFRAAPGDQYSLVVYSARLP